MNQSMNSHFLFIIIFIYALAHFANGFGCPQKCTCQQRTVRCLRQQMDQIPEVPSDTNIIDLRYNHIKEVPSNAFTGLSHLHTIFLNENQVMTLHPSAFYGLPSLKYLYLNKNHITNIAPNAFQYMDRLQSLYLQFNNISTFESQTFSNFPKLERLFLYANKIKHIPEGSFENMPSLKRLRLDSNVLDCDCAMMWFMKMLQEKKKSLVAAITCNTPNNMEGKNLNSLNEEDFHCRRPEITKEPKDIEINFGQTAIFTCQAMGDPQPEIVWMLNSNEIHSDDTRVNILPDGTLRIDEASNTDVGQYECMAKNKMGEALSRPARMIVHNDVIDIDSEAPKFIQTPYDTIVTVDDPIILHCVVSGAPQPKLDWTFNHNQISYSRVYIFTNGTLIINQSVEEDSGLYTCTASNNDGKVSVNATVQVNVLPRITIPPDNQTLKSGSHVTLECEAEGNPPPHVWWKRDGQPLGETNRIYFNEDNTELTIEHVKESDSGKYICVAENEVGITEITAEVVVTSDVGPPRFLFEPYDLEAIVGTTIELPCKSEDDAILQLKWRKDGRTITQTDKYRLSTSGSLYITNVTEVDSGRYECSILNQYGRATASGLITVRKNQEISPGDRYVRIAIAEASREVDSAINQTIAKLFSKNDTNPKHHGDLFRIVRFPSGPAREVARAAEVYERALVNIRKHVNRGEKLTTNHTEFSYQDLLSPEYLDLLNQLSGCMAHRVTPNCTDMCFHSKYRTLDGTCNNFHNPMLGASLTAFRRLKSPIYENGFSMPVGWTKTTLYNGFPKPSARLVSTSMISTHTITPDEEITHMVMQWGQFLDHDLDHAIPSVSSESWDGVDCKKTCEYAPPCYPIEIPENDPRVTNRRCIDFVRSSAICGSGMTSVFFGTIQPREQINQLTSYIDASQVYGYSEQFARDLRNLTTDDGLLREGLTFPNQRPLLPFASPTDGVDCRRNLDESTINCFTAGDIRVNEQVGLLSMHTIWFREHNRIASELRVLNPHWDGEQIYHEARKIVGAIMQHVTYEHWLPLIIGEDGMNIMGKHAGYDATINPSISNVFATAALRFGHSLINPVLHRLNENFEPIPQGHLPLHKAFFAPWRIVYEGGVDPLLRGLFSVPAKLKMPDQNLNSDLTEKLFETAHAVALDLAAINIQRSRDHALPGYNDYRKICNMKIAETFDDLKNEISNDQIRNKLKDLYGHPSNIDIWVGGILEDQSKGARVGPLFRCLLIEQFKKLRSGDRLWYENENIFKSEQLVQIKQATLGRVLCDNGDNITKVTDNVFILPKLQKGLQNCENIPRIDLKYWMDCTECARHHKRSNTISRQRRSRTRRDLKSISNNSIFSNDTVLRDDSDNYIDDDMNEERIEGLEFLIEDLQKSIKQLRRKLRKVEKSCVADNNNNSNKQNNNNNNNNYNNINKGKPHGHCIDNKGIKRLNNEIWMRDDCTKCECEHHQITCETEKCVNVECANKTILTKVNGKCCPVCGDDNKDKLDTTQSV